MKTLLTLIWLVAAITPRLMGQLANNCSNDDSACMRGLTNVIFFDDFEYPWWHVGDTNSNGGMQAAMDRFTSWDPNSTTFKTKWGLLGGGKAEIVSEGTVTFGRGTKSLQFDLSNGVTNAQVNLLKNLSPFVIPSNPSDQKLHKTDLYPQLYVRFYQKWESTYSVLGNSNHNGVELDGGLPPRAGVDPAVDGSAKFVLAFQADMTGWNDAHGTFSPDPNPHPPGTNLGSFYDTATNDKAYNKPPYATEVYMYWPGRSLDRFWASGWIKGFSRSDCTNPPFGWSSADYGYICGGAIDLKNGTWKQSFNGGNYVAHGDHVPLRNRWYCREFMVKVNTVTGGTPNHDGEIQTWIDGVETSHVTGLFLAGTTLAAGTPDNPYGDATTHYAIDRLWLGDGCGSAYSQPVGSHTKMWIDNVVLAKSYIGPINSSSVPPSFDGCVSPCTVNLTEGTSTNLPYSVSASGSGTITIARTSSNAALPPGVTTIPASGGTTGNYQFVGTPTTPGVYTQTLTATSAVSPPATYTLNFNVQAQSSVNHAPNTPTFSNPGAGQVFPSGASITATVTADDPDVGTDPNNDVAFVNFQLDSGALVKVNTSPGSNTYSTTFTGAAAGSHTVRATATDNQVPPLSSSTATRSISVNVATGPSPAKIIVTP